MRTIRATTISILALGLLAGSAVGVTAQDDDSELPVEFTGRLQCCFTWLEVSDPRLEGRVTIQANEKRYPAVGYRVWREAFRIENEDGAWQESPSVNLTFPENVAARRVGVFEGEGGYTGLRAIAELWFDRSTNVWEVRGVLIEDDLPPAPIIPE